MRSNLLALFAGCVVAVFVTAQSFTPTDVAWMGQLGGAAEESCESTDTVLPHDTMLEGFQGGYEQVGKWTEVGTVANIDDAADTTALTTGKPVGACVNALKIDTPTDGTETYTRYDHGSSIDVDTADLNVYFYLYIAEAPDVNGEVYNMFYVRNTAAGSACCYVALRNSSGNIQLLAGGAALSNAITVNTGEWLCVTLHIDTTVGECTIDVDGTTKAFTRAANDVRYLLVGPSEGLDANENGLLYFDLICMDVP